MHSWNTFVVKKNHGQIRTHKAHHNPDLGEATTFPLIIYFVPNHKTNTQMSFCPKTPIWNSQVGVPKFPKLGLSQLWGPITLCADLQLWWGLKQSCNPCWDFSNGMCHTTYLQRNRSDFWLLVVGSQIVNLTPGLSFGHNLCLKSPNGSCKPF